MRQFSILFVSSLLFSACLYNLSQVRDIATITNDLSIQEQIEEVKEKNRSPVAIPSSEKLDQANGDVTTTTALSSREQEKERISSNGFIFQGIALPREILMQVFSALSVRDIFQASHVCRAWYTVTQDPALWRVVRLRIHGDYPLNEATKEQAKLHTLRVQVNRLTDLTSMERLITQYALNKQRPFIPYQAFVYELIKNVTREVIDEQAAQGNEAAVDKKIEGLAYGDPEYDYELNPQAAVAYNEYLVAIGNKAALVRKIRGLSEGSYGYQKDPKEAVAFNDCLIEQGNEKAIKIKILGLADGYYGYEKDLEAAFTLNEHFVQQGHIKAIERKFMGLFYGFDGYKKNHEMAFALNEHLVAKGNPKAITRKIYGLAYGTYGYPQDIQAARVLNEDLVKQGHPASIIRKIKGLRTGEDLVGCKLSLYQKDLLQFKNWLDTEEGQGTRWACYLKAQGLKYGVLGFERNREAAIAYIKKYNIPY